MADLDDKQNDDQHEQYNINDDNISSLIEQIYEQLVCTITFCMYNVLGIANRLQKD